MAGHGVSANPSEAAKWIRRAAEDGDPRGQYNLAVMYGEGRGVAKNEKAATEWMRKAADQGLPKAQFGMGFATRAAMASRRAANKPPHGIARLRIRDIPAP